MKATAAPEPQMQAFGALLCVCGVGGRARTPWVVGQAGARETREDRPCAGGLPSLSRLARRHRLPHTVCSTTLRVSTSRAAAARARGGLDSTAARRLCDAAGTSCVRTHILPTPSSSQVDWRPAGWPPPPCASRRPPRRAPRARPRPRAPRRHRPPPAPACAGWRWPLPPACCPRLCWWQCRRGERVWKEGGREEGGRHLAVSFFVLTLPPSPPHTAALFPLAAAPCPCTPPPRAAAASASRRTSSPRKRGKRLWPRPKSPKHPPNKSWRRSTC